MPRVNLNTLASELAKDDGPAGLNISVTHVKAVLGALGRLMRKENTLRVISVLFAIWNRAGKDGPA